MTLSQPRLSFKRPLSRRPRTTTVVLHHSGTPMALHELHLANGWEGVGYHYLIQRTGRVWALRPVGMIGRHAALPHAKPEDPPTWMEQQSIALCFEGNFEEGQPSSAQCDAGIDLIGQLAQRYPELGQVLGHREVPGCRTVCPGAGFPLGTFAAALDAARQALGPRQWQIVTRGACLPLYVGPGAQYEQLQWLRPGTQVQLIGKEPNRLWRKVEACGQVGYVDGEYLLPVD